MNCTRCGAAFGEDVFMAGGTDRCPSCGAPVRMEVFPALWRPLAPLRDEGLPGEGEASCFHHPRKKAVVVCQRCGRFLCRLCDLEIDGTHLCSACIEASLKKGRLQALEPRRVLYGRIALALAVWPALLVWPTLLTAPAAVYVAVRYWKAPSSLVGRRKIDYLLAILVASLETTLWVLFFAWIFF